MLKLVWQFLCQISLSYFSLPIIWCIGLGEFEIQEQGTRFNLVNCLVNPPSNMHFEPSDNINETVWKSQLSHTVGVSTKNKLMKHILSGSSLGQISYTFPWGGLPLLKMEGLTASMSSVRKIPTLRDTDIASSSGYQRPEMQLQSWGILNS